MHLVREVGIAGPVHCRWMYWLERYMATLKGYVRNRARVEGSMAMGYLAAEKMFYCSNNLAMIDHSIAKIWLEEKDEEEDRLTGAVKKRMLTSVEWTQLTIFMLSNSNVMDEWREFYENAKNQSRQPRIFPKFHEYMKSTIADLDNVIVLGGDISHYPLMNDDIRTLVHGPLRRVTTRSAIWTQGRHFRYFIYTL